MSKFTVIYLFSLLKVADLGRPGDPFVVFGVSAKDVHPILLFTTHRLTSTIIFWWLVGTMYSRKIQPLFQTPNPFFFGNPLTLHLTENRGTARAVNSPSCHVLLWSFGHNKNRHDCLLL